MSPWWKYLALYAGVTVILPVFLVLLAGFLRVKRFPLSDFLGDGQLCFYAITVGLFTILDLAEATAGQGEKTVGFLVMGACGLTATFMWAIIVMGYMDDDRRPWVDKWEFKRRRNRATWSSVLIAAATVVAGGLIRESWGIL